ncbi:rod shape-determining protein RodA [Rhodobacterales bacterium LSUCC0387]|nr:rod shape-determining protein RodA [Rhodobacterales bacterium LSUCC0387]
MSFSLYQINTMPSGWRKVLYFNWPLVVLLTLVSCIGFMMLYAVAGGSTRPWVIPQVQRFALGMTAMFIIALIPIAFWRMVSWLGYAFSLVLLLIVEFFGTVGMGAQRWIDLGGFRLQPSELAKITIVMVLAAYYARLDPTKKSHPLYILPPLILILVPVFLTLKQPDLGTALLLLLGGGAVVFAAGVHWAYFGGLIAAGVGAVFSVFASRGTSWQLIKDYQFRRIDTFLDPTQDPLGAGYHITQSQIALGSGGFSGRGFMEGTQSRLNFLPEKHTDFIFTTLAEEFGFIGASSLLFIYLLIVALCIWTALSTKDRFASLLSIGIAATFFLYFAINMAMVMGLTPVVGVPLPLVSYGGSVMMVVLAAFGLVQSAHIHRPR